MLGGFLASGGQGLANLVLAGRGAACACAQCSHSQRLIDLTLPSLSFSRTSAAPSQRSLRDDLLIQRAIIRNAPTSTVFAINKTGSRLTVAAFPPLPLPVFVAFLHFDIPSDSPSHSLSRPIDTLELLEFLCNTRRSVIVSLPST